jgi:hypothetical protein
MIYNYELPKAGESALMMQKHKNIKNTKDRVNYIDNQPIKVKRNVFNETINDEII